MLVLLLLLLLLLLLMCSTQQQPKVLWMEDSNSTEVAQLAANNRASDASSTDCGTRQVTGNCCTRGGSPSPVEFSNRVPLHTLSGENPLPPLQTLSGENPLPPLQTLSGENPLPPLHTLSGERIRETLQIHPIPHPPTSSQIRLEFYVRNPRRFGNLLLCEYLHSQCWVSSLVTKAERTFLFYGVG